MTTIPSRLQLRLWSLLGIVVMSVVALLYIWLRWLA